MSTKNTHKSSYLTRAVRRRSIRSTVRAYLPGYSRLAFAAGLALCLAGCPMQEIAELPLEQDVIDSLVEGVQPTSAQDPPPDSAPPVDPPDEDTPVEPAQPAISAIQPTQGPSGGGTRVTVRGTGLSSATGVFFGEVAASNLTIVSDETITAMTPAHPEGDVWVSIELVDGILIAGPFEFSFLGSMCPNYDPSIDSDEDGLADGLEACGWRIAVDLYGFGTDHPSGLRYVRVVSDPNDPDTDIDGLSDYDEYLIGCDPRDQDTDDDGLIDTEEVYRWLTSPVSVDSDGDANGDNDALPPNASLFDGAELKIDFASDPTHTPAIDATSPTSDDTDGDGRSDYEELDHAVLSPVIADLPALELEVVDEIDVLLNVEYAEEAGTSTEYGTSFSRATTISEHWYTGGTLQVGMGTSLTVGVEAEVGFPSNGAKAKTEATVSMNVSYSQEWQVGGEKSEELRNESSRLEAKSRTHTETVSSGAISTGIVLTNTGPVSYCLTDLGMTVRLFERGVDPDDPLYVGSFKTVATLVPVLGDDGFTLAPGQSTPVLQVQAENVNVDRIRDFLRSPQALHLEQAYFEMETAEGLNYGFIEEATRASTATLMIDFGDGEWHKQRFATNVNRDANGNATGVRMADALDLLGIGFQTTMKYEYDGGPEICRVLTHIQKDDGTWLPEEPDPNNIDRYAMWVAFGTNDDFENETLDFEDVVLHAGDVAMLVFALDADQDALYGWEEDHYGSSDDAGNDDYDGDGLTDGEEVNPQDDGGGGYTSAGWDVQVGDDPPYRAFSDPRLADGDDDGLTDLDEKLGQDGFPPGDPSDTGDATDPNKRDTDADGIDDAADPWPVDPARILRVDDDAVGAGDGTTWEDAYPSLQNAITDAQTFNGDGDATNDVTEIWVANGSYTFTESQPLLPRVGIYGGFVGGETKRAQRASSYGSVLDGTGYTGPAFYTYNPGGVALNAVLDGFQISNWSVPTAGGGAIDFYDAANVTLRNILFLENSADYGGVIRDLHAGSILMENCVFGGNVAANSGGVLYGSSALDIEIRDCRFENNQAAYSGGAIYLTGAGTLSVSGSTFYQNKVDNTTSGDAGFVAGGAIYLWDADDFSLQNCIFSGNRGETPYCYRGAGGAVFSDAEYTSVVNCLFLKNVLYTWPGDPGRIIDGCGLFAQTSSPAGQAYVTNCTFVGNERYGTDYIGAALQMRGPGLKQAVNVVSTNSGVYLGRDSNLEFSVHRFDPSSPVWYDPTGDAGPYAVRDVCLWDGFGGVVNGNGFDDADIVSANPAEVIVVDPGFVDWENGDVHLLETSPLIDVGYNFVDIDPAAPGFQFLPEFDLDGNFRIVDGDGNGVATVDIGAYEYSPY